LVKSSAKTAGFRDVAERAGVSITTVERVLNERGSVSQDTRLKVLEAATQLRLRRVLPNPDYGNLRIEAILPDSRSPYWLKLSAGLKEASTQLPRGIALHRTFVPQGDAQAMIRAIETSRLKRSALIIAAEDGSDMARTLKGTTAYGQIVVFISTKVHCLSAAAFSGIDNLAAGRTAASLINFGLRGRSGTVLVLQATRSMQSHSDRLNGFRSALDRRFGIEVAVTNEVPGASRNGLAEMLAQGRVPLAIYEIGDPGDEIAPIVRSFEEKPIWIGHERNQAHDALMREGVLDFVLDQDPERQVRWALRHILSGLGVANSTFSTVRRPELRLFNGANIGESKV
jgi:LacI family transcriptional regulator